MSENTEEINNSVVQKSLAELTERLAALEKRNAAGNPPDVAKVEEVEEKAAKLEVKAARAQETATTKKAAEIAALSEDTAHALLEAARDLSSSLRKAYPERFNEEKKSEQKSKAWF